MTSPENFVPFMPHGEATPASIQGTIEGALELLGPNGENWLKGQLRGFSPNPSGGGVTFAFCVVGALEAAARATWLEVQATLEQTATRV